MSEKKYRIGYTTGVFDLFHIGHLNVLMNAKRQCEYLIVGVSTDELVEEYKKKRPVIPFRERIEIVKSIRYVDEAVPQISMDKFEAWNKYHFDAIFHGDDWKNSEMYNKYIQEFDGTGVDFVFLPHTDGTSSTILTEVLQNLRDERK